MRAFALLGLLLAGSAAIAAETITYTYDARGRLIEVTHTGGPSDGKKTCYSLDTADNRTVKTTATACTGGGGGGGGGGGPSFSVNNVSANEGNNLVFTVTKSGTATGSTGVSYATANGTASSNDYTAKSGTLTFTIAQTQQTVSVQTTEDSTDENNETIFLNLSNATGGATISDNQGVGTIFDDDTGGTNQPPVANFDNAGSMSCGDSMTFNVVANDTDPDGNLPLSLVSASGSSGILVSKANNTDVQITSTGASSGTKSFSYVIQDSLGAQDTGSGSVTVLAPCQ